MFELPLGCLAFLLQLLALRGPLGLLLAPALLRFADMGLVPLLPFRSQRLEVRRGAPPGRFQILGHTAVGGLSLGQRVLQLGDPSAELLGRPASGFPLGPELIALGPDGLEFFAQMGQALVVAGEDLESGVGQLEFAAQVIALGAGSFQFAGGLGRRGAGCGGSGLGGTVSELLLKPLKFRPAGLEFRAQVFGFRGSALQGLQLTAQRFNLALGRLQLTAQRFDFGPGSLELPLRGAGFLLLAPRLAEFRLKILELVPKLA